MTVVRRAAQTLAVPLAVLITVTAQLVVVNRAPLPGRTGPDLVLLVVTAIAVCTGPMTGLLAGFAGGLAVDVAPPAAHLAGEYALVFCLAGYACGRAGNAIKHATGEQRMGPSLLVMALGTAAGEAGKAALGLLLSDPDVTRPAVRHVLPGAIVYDLVLCPFVYWVVSLALRRPAPERAPRPELTRVATAFRAASAGTVGAVPRLRLAGATLPPVRPPARAEPKLRLASGRSAPLSGTYAAFSPAPTPVPGGRPVKLNFSQNGHAAPGQRQRTSPGKGWLRAEGPSRAPSPRRSSPPKGWIRAERPAGMAAAARRSSPPKGWIRAERPGRPTGAGSVKRTSLGKGWVRAGRSGVPGAPGAPSLRRTPAGKAWLRAEGLTGAPGLRRTSPGKGWLRAGRPTGMAVPRRGSPGGRWLRPGRGNGMAAAMGRSSPGKRWLRPAKPAPGPRLTEPPRGWIRPARPAPLPKRKSPGRRWIRPSKAARRTSAGSPPSTRWVRRSHSRWRGRRRRLLALVAGRR